MNNNYFNLVNLVHLNNDIKILKNVHFNSNILLNFHINHLMFLYQ